MDANARLMERKGYEYASLTDTCNIDIYWVHEQIKGTASAEFIAGYKRYINEKEQEAKP